jgi:AhpD family alkylhydroperoxidase
MSHFRDHTVDTAPAAARPILAATRDQAGFVPIAMARQAEAPLVLSAFARLHAMFESSSLAPLEREVVAFAVAHEVGCELCVAFHSMLLSGGDATLLADLRAARPLADARLEAVRRFTLAVLASHGAASDPDLAAFHAAGLTNQHALEIVLGVATYQLSTYANRLVRAPVDPALAAFA